MVDEEPTEDQPALQELARVCGELNFKRSLTSEAEELGGLVAVARCRSTDLLGRVAATHAGCAAVRSESFRVRDAAQALRARPLPTSGSDPVS